MGLPNKIKVILELTVMCTQNLNRHASMILGIWGGAQADVPYAHTVLPWAHTTSHERTSKYLFFTTKILICNGVVGEDTQFTKKC